MHFEAATPTLTAAEQLYVVVAQMASLTTMLETIMQTTQVETLEKHKRDLTNQVKADVIISTADLETCVETIDAKVAFPKIDQAIIRPE
eukprot:scaffold324058_cov24-Attheya_sp.AAC.1